jgi:hypothetical protein
MMKGEPVRPQKFVTHNWGNLFRDLIAGILADALSINEFGIVAHLMDKDFPALEEQLIKSGNMEQTYWVCAFCVAQHSCICHTTLVGDVDPVLGTPHPACDCLAPKYMTTTGEVDDLGRSIQCEMNKFDDMLAYLAYTEEHLEQLIVADAKMDVFTRAWCVAEVAEAFKVGIPQCLIVKSDQLVSELEVKLRQVKVQNMVSSRPEDILAILAKIPDADAFNAQLQSLFFDKQDGLLARWQKFDAVERFDHVGRLARLQMLRISSSL